MADKTTPTQEETLTIINQRAKDADSFFVRIFRKQHMGGLPETVATFDEAQIEHLTSPERWLPQLAGGGPVFMFQVFHSSDRGAMLGGFLHFAVPTTNLAPKTSAEIDPRIVKRAGWSGPRQLLYPTIDAKPVQENPLFSISPNNLPPASPSGNSAANNVPGGGVPGAAFPRDVVYERNAAILQQIEEERAKLQRQREEFQEQQRRDREELAEQKRRAELDAIRRESDAKLEAIKRELQHAAAAAPKSDVSTMVAQIGAAFSPVILKLLESQNETRLAVMRQQEATAAAAAESNRQLMSAMLTRPSIDPVVERLFSELKSAVSQQVPQSTMLHSMADAMASMTQTTMDLVQTAADLNIGGGKEEDHPALKAIREGVKAVQSIFAGYQAQLPRTPAHHQPPPAFRPIPQALPHAPAPAQPTVVPAATPAASGQAAAPAAPPENLVQLPPARDVLELLENMFKAQVAVGDVVDTFIRAFKAGDAVLHNALDAAGGEIEVMFSQRLGAFVLANPQYVPYLEELQVELNRRGAEEGIFEPEPDESDYAEDHQDQDAA